MAIQIGMAQQQAAQVAQHIYANRADCSLIAVLGYNNGATFGVEFGCGNKALITLNTFAAPGPALDAVIDAAVAAAVAAIPPQLIGA